MRQNSSLISRKSVLRLVGLSLLAGTATGCSSDVLRFQDGFYTGSTAATNSDQMTTSSIQSNQGVLPPMNTGQTTQQTMASQGQYQSGVRPMAQPFPAAVESDQSMNYRGGGYGSAAVTGSALPPPGQPALAPAPAVADHARVAEAHPARPSGWSASNGSRVTLRPGETVFTLARRYGVPADAIMKANGIQNASAVQPGRELLIPTYSYGRNVPVSSPDHDPRVRNAAAEEGRHQDVAMAAPAAPGFGGTTALRAPAQRSAATAPASTGTYVVASGDTLTRIAAKSGVSIDALKRENGLSNGQIRIGQRLRLPQGGHTVAAAEPDRMVTAATPRPAAAAPAPRIEPVKAAPAARVAPAAAPVKMAAANPAPAAPQTASVAPAAAPAETPQAPAVDPVGTDTASAAPESSGIGKLRWPVRGQVVSRYGSREDGNRNDGIDISVPEGTPVKAAENGVVIYAGNGLKEYGNTVLVRHDDGMVTVYGYAKDLKVKRGDKVTRGEVIADSGMSGAAQRPKLHFEVRKDASPVDPLTFLD